jgi:D-alanyl-D-alanine carboxypeptidase (penicillin-binding protein 5/6)
MRNHNHLLGKLAGCDGLKTGYFSAAGYSLAATVERNGRRVIAVVLGSEASKTRDFKVMELVEKGFAATAAALPAVKPAVAPTKPTTVVAKPAVPAEIPTVKTDKSGEQNSTPKDPVVVFRVTPLEKKP